jgi:hypothetical protein
MKLSPSQKRSLSSSRHHFYDRVSKRVLAGMGLLLFSGLSMAAETPAAAPLSKAEEAKIKEAEISLKRGWLNTLPDAQITFGLRASDHLVDGYTDFLIPVWQPHENGLVFFNFRPDWNDDSQQLYSMGGGYRAYLDVVKDYPIILGANSYYDHIVTPYGNEISQWGTGVEVLSKWVDARFNYYVPEGTEFVVGDGGTTGSIAPSTIRATGHQILSSGGGGTLTSFNLVESGLKGWYTEAGVLMPYVDRIADLRFFGGYYDYHNPSGIHIQGMKGRGELRVSDALTFDVEYYEDEELMGGKWTAGARVTVPFEFSRLAEGGNPFAGITEAFTHRSRDVKSRMTEMVIRSARVRTGGVQKKVAKTETVPASKEEVLADDIVVVDPAASPGGNGTFESPINDLSLLNVGITDIAVSAGGMATVYVRGGANLGGNISIGGINFNLNFVSTQTGIPLLNGGVFTDGSGRGSFSDNGTVLDLTANGLTSFSMMGFDFLGAGTALQLNGFNSVAISDVVFANGASRALNVSNVNTLTVTGIPQMSRVRLDNVGQATFTGTAFNVTGGPIGLEIINTGGTFNLPGSVIGGTTTAGISVNNTGGQALTISGVTMSNVGGDGLLVQGTNGATTFSDVTINGVQAGSNGASFLNNSGPLTLNNLNLTAGAGNGLVLTGNTNTVSINNGSLNSITGDAINVTNTALTVNGTQFGNTAAITGNGVVINNTDGGSRAVAVTNTTMQNIGGSGIRVVHSGAGELTSNLSGNTITAAGDGMFVQKSGAGDLSLTLTGNTLASTGGAGAHLDGIGGAGILRINAFGGNTVTQAAAGGLLVDTATFNVPTAPATPNVIGSTSSRVNGDGLRLANVQGTLALGNVNIFNDGGTGLLVSGPIALSSTGGTVNTINGTGANITGAALNLTLGSISSTGGATGLNLVNATGSFTVNGGATAGQGGTLEGTGSAVNLNGGSVNLTLNDMILQNFGVNGATVTSHTGTFILDGSTVNGTGSSGDGVNVTVGAGGTTGVAINNVAFSNLAGDGVSVNGTSGTQVTNSTFNTIGGNGIDLRNTTGLLVLGNNTEVGGGVTGDTVLTQNNTGSSYDITGGLGLAPTSIHLINETGNLALSGINFSSLEVDGGSANVTLNNVILTGNTVNNVVDINGTTAGTISFVGTSSITQDGTSGGDGLVLDNVDGNVNFGTLATTLSNGARIQVLNGSAGTINFGDVSIDGTGLAADAVNLTGANGTVTFVDLDITNFNAAGQSALNLAGANGAVTVNGFSVAGAQGTAVNINGGTVATTFNGFNATMTNGSGLVANGGGLLTITGATNTITTTNGPAIDLNNLQAAITLQTVSATSSTAEGIDIDGLTGSVTVTGNTTISGTAAGFDGLAISNSAATFNFQGTTTIDNTGDEGIALAGANGAVTFGSIDIDGTTGRGFEVTGATNNVTVNGGTIGASNDAGDFSIRVDNQVAGSTITFNNVSTTAGTGDNVNLEANNGTVNFTGGTATQTGANDILDIESLGATGVVNFGSALVHTGTGQAVEIDASAGTVNISGTIAATNGSQIALIGATSAITGGTITFSGAATETGGNGIGISNVNAGASVAFIAPVTITNPAADAVTLSGNAGTVSFSSLTLTTNAGRGLVATNQTGLLTVTTGSINATGGAALDLDTVLGNLTFTSLSSANSTAEGIDIDALTGSLTVTGNTTVNGTAAAFDGLAISNSAATFNFQGTTTISGLGDERIALDGANGDITFASINLNGGSGRGVDIDGATNDVTFNGGSIGAVTPVGGFTIAISNQVAGSVVAFNNVSTTAVIADNVNLSSNGGTVSILGGTHTQTAGNDVLDVESLDAGGVVNFSGALVHTGTGQAVEIDASAGTINISGTVNATGGAQGVRIGSTGAITGGSITFSGAVTQTGGPGSSISNVNAGASVAFTNTLTITNSTADALTLSGNAGTVSFSNLTLATNAGRGLVATNQTGLLTVTTGSVNAAGGAALDLNNVLGNLTFTSLASTNSSAEGLDIDGTLAGTTLTVSGTTSVTNSAAAGIDITNSVGTFTFASVDIETTGGHGVGLNAAGTVAINGGTIDGTTVDGINSTNTVLTVSGVTIGGTTAAGGDGIQIASTDGVSRIITLNNNSIRSVGHAITSTDSGTAGELVFNLNGNTLQTTGAGSRAINLVGSGANSTIVASMSGGTVIGNGVGGGLLFDRITFDASGTALSGTQVNAGTWNIGQGTGTRVAGDGASFLNPTGSLSFTALNIFNNNGTGLEVDTKGLGTTFALGTLGGSVDTTNGMALFLDPLTINMTLTSVSSTNSAGAGLVLDTVAGTLTIGTTTITNSGGAGILAQNNTGTLNANFGATTINTTGGSGIDLNDGGTYTFGTTSVTNATGDALDLDGTSGIIQFGATTISGGGANGVDVNGSTGGSVTIASLTIDGTTGNGIDLTNNAGTFMVSGLTSIGATTGVGGNAIDINGTSSGAINFGDIDIANLANNTVAFDVNGADAAVTANTLDINGTGSTGVIAIDLRSTQNNRLVTITNGGTIQGVAVGVQIGSGITGDFSQTANANFTYDAVGGNGSSITATTALEARGLVTTSGVSSGQYHFENTNLTGATLFEPTTGTTYYFVSGVADGVGDGSTPTNAATIATADGVTGSNVVFVLLNDDGTITLGGTAFSLSSGQGLDSFGNGQSFNPSSGPANIYLSGSIVYTDANTGGFGAATLTNTAGDIVSVGGSNLIQNFTITGVGGASIGGTGFNGLEVMGMTLNGTGDVFDFTNAAGNITITNNTINQSGGNLLNISGGNAIVQLTAGTGSITNSGGGGLNISGTTGGNVTVSGVTISGATSTPLVFDNNDALITVTNSSFATAAGVTLIDIDTGTGGSTTALTLDNTNTLTHSSGTIATIGAGARDIDLSAHNFTNTGSTSVAVNVTGQTGGTISFGNLTSVNATAAQVINSTGQAGGTLSFGTVNITGYGDATTDLAVNLQGTAGTAAFADLDVTTTNGAGLATGGITLNPGASTTINATGGTALLMNGTTMNGTFASVTSTNSGAGNNGIELTNVTGAITFTLASVTNAGANGIVVGNSAANVTFNTVDIDTTVGTGLAFLGNNTGNMQVLGGTIDGAGNSALISQNTNLVASNLTIGGTTVGTGFGILVENSAAVTRTVTLSNNTVHSDDIALAASAIAGTLNLAADGNTFDSQSNPFAVTVVGGPGQLNVTSFNGNTVVGSAAGGTMLFDTVTFDATPGGAINAVNGGTTQIGTLANRVQSDGLVLLDTTGALNFTSLTIFNNTGTGLEVDTTGGTTFDLGVTTGTINTTNGSAMILTGPTLGVNATFTSVQSTNATGDGVSVSNITGTLNINSATVSGATSDGISLTGGGTMIFGNVDLDNNTTGVNITSFTGNASFAVGGGQTFTLDGGTTGISLVNNSGTISFGNFTSTNPTATRVINSTGQTGGTVTFGAVAITGYNSAANTAVNFQGTGGTVNFSDLDIATTNGSGLSVGGIAFNPGSSATINATNGSALTLSGTALGAGATFTSVQSTNATGDGISVSNITGTLNINSATVSGATSDGISLTGGGTINFGNVDLDNNATGVNITSFTGSALFAQGGGQTFALDGGATGLSLVNNTGTINIANATIGGTTTQTTQGVNINGGTADIDITGSIRTNSTSSGIAVNNLGATATVNITNGASTAVNVIGGRSIDIGSGNNAAAQITFGHVTTANTTGAGLELDGSEGTIAFGNVTITNPTATGINLNAATGDYTMGNVAITFTGAGRGIDLRDSNIRLETDNLTITGNGAVGSIGIDLSGSLNPNGANSATSNIRLAQGTGGGEESAVITNVRTGIQLGDATDGSAGAYLVYGNQTADVANDSVIDVVVGGFTLNTTNLTSTNPFTQGRYEFLGVDFSGDFASFQTASNLIFVSAVADGLGDGTSKGNAMSGASLAALTAAQLDNRVIVLVNDDGAISLGSDTLLFGANTRLTSFGGGNTVSAFTVPVNIIVDTLPGANVSDVNGAGTLTATAGNNVVQLGTGSHFIDHVGIFGGNFNIFGNNAANLTVDNATLGGGAAGTLSLTGATGTITIQNTTITNSTGGTLLSVTGATTSNVTIQNTVNITQTGGFLANINGGSATVNFSHGGTYTNSGTIRVQSATGGTYTFNNTDSDGLATGGAALSIDSNAAGVTVNLNDVDVTNFNGAGQSAVVIAGNNAGTTINITDLDVTTTAGSALNGGGGGTVVFSGTGHTLAAGNGSGLNLSGTLNLGSVTFDSISATGTGAGIVVSGVTTTGLTVNGGTISGMSLQGVALTGGTYGFTYAGTISNTTGLLVDLDARGGSSTFSGALSDSNGGAGIEVTNATAATSFTSTVAISSGTGTGVNLSGNNAAGTVSFTNLSVGTTGTAVASTNQTGALTISAGSLSGSTGLNANNTTLAATVTSITGSGGANAVVLTGTTSGTLTSGTTTATNTTSSGIALSNTGTLTANFGTTSVTSAAADSISLVNTAAGSSITFGATTIDARDANTRGIFIDAGSGTIAFGAVDVDNTAGSTGSAIRIEDRTAGTVTMTSATADLAAANAVGIDLSANVGTVDIAGGGTITGSGATMAAVAISGGTGAISLDSAINISNGTGVRIDGHSTGTIDMDGAITLTGGTGRIIDIGGTTGVGAGQIQFDGAVTQTGGGTGIRIINSTAAALVDFNAAVALGTSGSRNTGGVVMTGNAAGTDVDFNNGLTVFVNGATALLASGNGALDVTGGGELNQTGAGSAIDITTVTGNLNFTAVRKSSGTGPGITITTSSGTKSLGDLDLTTTDSEAILLNNAGTVGSTSGTVATTNRAAASVTSSAMNFTLDSVTSTNSTGDGLFFSGATGTFAVSTSGLAAGGTLTGMTGEAVDVNGGSANISYHASVAAGGAAISKSTAGRIIQVQNTTGGTVTINAANGATVTGEITVTGAALTGGTAGILIQNANGSVNINNFVLGTSAAGLTHSGVTILGGSAAATYTLRGDVTMATGAGANEAAVTIGATAQDQAVGARLETLATVNYTQGTITAHGSGGADSATVLRLYGDGTTAGGNFTFGDVTMVSGDNSAATTTIKGGSRVIDIVDLQGANFTFGTITHGAASAQTGLISIWDPRNTNAATPTTGAIHMVGNDASTFIFNGAIQINDTSLPYNTSTSPLTFPAVLPAANGSGTGLFISGGSTSNYRFEAREDVDTAGDIPDFTLIRVADGQAVFVQGNSAADRIRLDMNLNQTVNFRSAGDGVELRFVDVFVSGDPTHATLRIGELISVGGAGGLVLDTVNGGTIVGGAASPANAGLPPP